VPSGINEHKTLVLDKANSMETGEKQKYETFNIATNG
jgi:hypothetical protein